MSITCAIKLAHATLACMQAIVSGSVGSAGAGPSTAVSPTPHDDLAGDLYALVVYLHKNCSSDLFEAVGVLELSLTQIKLLHQLEDATSEITLKRAAELVHVSLPAASRMVDDLVRRGFVARHEDAEDRRMKRVSITDSGHAVIRRLNAARLNRLQQFTGSLTEPERRDLATALIRLLQRPDVAACRLEDA
jgi:DNA-binding MarR family transcriptional regulator